MTASYNDLYLDVRKALKRMGIEAAALEARELICAASGKSREQFFRDLPLYAPDFVQAKLDELLSRRLQGEPVAYLVGEWEFYGLTLSINRHVLIPRADTEVLAKRAIELMEKAGEGGRILDLCAGSGCVGLAVSSQVKSCRAVLVDLSTEAILLCKQNIRRNQLNGRVTAMQGDARHEPDPTLWDFDVIACNPPYIPTGDIQGLDPAVRDFEPRMALDGGADGLDFYREVSALWASSLRLGGSLLFEVGIGQADAVKNILEEAGYVQIEIHQDGAGIPRVVEGSVPIE
jgi:release factor glutamine methyltransferase